MATFYGKIIHGLYKLPIYAQIFYVKGAFALDKNVNWVYTN